jgi:hypothetical protein
MTNDGRHSFVNVRYVSTTCPDVKPAPPVCQRTVENRLAISVAVRARL